MCVVSLQVCLHQQGETIKRRVMSYLLLFILCTKNIQQLKMGRTILYTKLYLFDIIIHSFSQFFCYHVILTDYGFLLNRQ